MDYRLLTRRYLKYSIELNQEEKDYIQTLADWFPKVIIDCHAHCNLYSHITDIPQKSLNSMITTFPYYSITDSKKINHLLYPKSVVRTLRFPHAFRGIDHKSANTYLLQECDYNDGVALFGLPEDTGYTISMLKKHKPNALKMYYFYPEKTAETIYETFPEEVLEVAEELGIPIILHVPRVITESKDDLLRVAKEYPKLKICVPHLGSTKFLIPNLEETYNELSTNTDIFLDTSLNASYEVIKLAFKYFGPTRIMFGSDQPLNLVRARSFINPSRGQRLITDYNYHWVDKEEHAEFKHLATNLIHSHWGSVNALKKVIDEYPVKDQDKIKDMVFFTNAKLFYKFN